MRFWRRDLQIHVHPPSRCWVIETWSCYLRSHRWPSCPYSLIIAWLWHSLSSYPSLSDVSVVSMTLFSRSSESFCSQKISPYHPPTRWFCEEVFLLILMGCVRSSSIEPACLHVGLKVLFKPFILRTRTVSIPVCTLREHCLDIQRTFSIPVWTLRERCQYLSGP